MTVEEIIDISPAYNADKSNKPRKTKKRKLNEPALEKPDHISKPI